MPLSDAAQTSSVVRVDKRIWILVALAAMALLLSGTPVFRDASHTDTSTEIFNTILHDSYAGWTGFHECLQTSVSQHDLCWAELHKGPRYRQVEIALDMSQPTPQPTEVEHHDPYVRGPVHIAAVEGHGTANTRDYGWAFLMRTLNVKKLPQTFVAVDGDSTGFPPQMFSFHCTGTPAQITCRNALGDYLTYTPNKKL